MHPFCTPQVAVEKLLEELDKLQNTLRNILTEAQENAKQSIENFVEDKVRKMGAMIGHYFTAFQVLNVMSRKDMDEAVKKMYNLESIRDAEESLYQAEDEWNTFLEEVDAKINPSSGHVEDDELVVGSYGPCKLNLIEVSTERLVKCTLLTEHFFLASPLACTLSFACLVFCVAGLFTLFFT